MDVAQVYELDVARARRDARRAGEIPADVWAEVQAANRLFEELQAEGQHVVFDDGRLHGRLVINLCDLEGRVLRDVSVSEVVAPVTQLPAARWTGGAA